MVQSLLMASFASGDGPAFVARHGQTALEYKATFNEWTGKGYQPICVSVYRRGATARYASIFHETAGPDFVARHDMDETQYRSQIARWAAEGYRPRSLSAARVGGKTVFACIFERDRRARWWMPLKRSVNWVARHGLTTAQFQTTLADLVGKGFRLRGVCPYAIDDEDRYLFWLEKDPAQTWTSHRRLSESAFRQTHESLAVLGYDLVSGGSCIVGGEDLYAGLWEKGPAASIGHHGMTPGAYDANLAAAVVQNLRPVFVSGYSGEVPVDVNLRFRIQRQQQSNWCWAACSVSVRRFYRSASTLTQCQLVDRERGRNDCCTAGRSAACNRPNRTAHVLQRLGHLRSLAESSVPYYMLRDESAAGRPTFLRIQWSGGGRHAVLATGVEDGDFVIVCDPGRPSAADPNLGTTSIVDYETLRTNYRGRGSWIATGKTIP